AEGARVLAADVDRAVVRGHRAHALPPAPTEGGYVDHTAIDPERHRGSTGLEPRLGLELRAVPDLDDPAPVAHVRAAQVHLAAAQLRAELPRGLLIHDAHAVLRAVGEPVRGALVVDHALGEQRGVVEPPGEGADLPRDPVLDEARALGLEVDEQEARV